MTSRAQVLTAAEEYERAAAACRAVDANYSASIIERQARDLRAAATRLPDDAEHRGEHEA